MEFLLGLLNVAEGALELGILDIVPGSNRCRGVIVYQGEKILGIWL
jgi:hypothetical protein